MNFAGIQIKEIEFTFVKRDDEVKGKVINRSNITFRSRKSSPRHGYVNKVNSIDGEPGYRNPIYSIGIKWRNP